MGDIPQMPFKSERDGVFCQFKASTVGRRVGTKGTAVKTGLEGQTQHDPLQGTHLPLM